MNADRLLALYDCIADTPEAVPQLRRFVLDLAVRGKLVPQDPDDEPAAQLLKRIVAEKARLAKSGTVRKGVTLRKSMPDSLPFDLRIGWNAVTIREILIELQTGPFGSSLHQSDYQIGGTPVINPASIQNERIVAIDKMAVGPAILEKLSTFKLRTGDIVMGRRGEMGRCAVVTECEDGWLCGTGSLILRLSEAIFARFLVLLIGSPYAREYLRGSAIGATMQNLNQNILLSLVFGLPPLAEQHRIVARVDELMALCDRLEAAREAREAARDRMAAASLARLNRPDPDPKTFRDHAAFTLKTLAPLTTRPDQIKALRQTILNLAVRGKLVPQDPSDEPASEMLQRIAKERATKAKAEKVRTKRSVSIASEEAIVSLPNGWGLEAIGNLVDPTATISYGVLVPGPDVDDGVPFVRAQDLSLAGHAPRPNKTISPEIEAPYARTRLKGGEILLCVVGSIGKLGIAPPSWAGANIARAVSRIAPVDAISAAYLLLAMRSDLIQNYFTEATRTLAQPTLNVGLIEVLPVPLPPLAEQRRIVAKVDELMALCDRLEASLTATDATRRRLLEAVLREALAPEARNLEAAE